MLKIYCDGSCKGNGKAHSQGGYGVAIFQDDELVEVSHEQYTDTTNNRMELLALETALSIWQNHYAAERCEIIMDSAYVYNTLTSWAFKWKENNWMRGNQEIANKDIIIPLFSFYQMVKHNCVLTLVEGHKGNVGNEIADALATFNERKIKRLIEEHAIKTSLDF